MRKYQESIDLLINLALSAREASRQNHLTLAQKLAILETRKQLLATVATLRRIYFDVEDIVNA